MDPNNFNLWRKGRVASRDGDLSKPAANSTMGRCFELKDDVGRWLLTAWRPYYPFVPDYWALRNLTGGGPNRELFLRRGGRTQFARAMRDRTLGTKVGTVMSVVHMFLFLPSFS